MNLNSDFFLVSNFVFRSYNSMAYRLTKSLPYLCKVKIHPHCVINQNGIISTANNHDFDPFSSVISF